MCIYYPVQAILVTFYPYYFFFIKHLKEKSSWLRIRSAFCTAVGHINDCCLTENYYTVSCTSLALVNKRFLQEKLSDEDKNIDTQEEKNNSLRTFLVRSRKTVGYRFSTPNWKAQRWTFQDANPGFTADVSPQAGPELAASKLLSPRDSTPNPVSRRAFFA